MLSVDYSMPKHGKILGVMPIIARTMTIFDEDHATYKTVAKEVFDQILSDYDKALEYFKQTTVTPTLRIDKRAGCTKC